MKKNVGSADKIFRIILGLALIVIGFVYSTWWGALGIIPLATAFMGSCPLYLMVGISTCKTEKTTN